MWTTNAWISTPPPITKPIVVLWSSDVGFDVVVRELVLVGRTVWVTVLVRPLNVSQATPASTYGRTIRVGNRYFNSSGNSQEFAVVRSEVVTVGLVRI